MYLTRLHSLVYRFISLLVLCIAPFTNLVSAASSHLVVYDKSNSYQQTFYTHLTEQLSHLGIKPTSIPPEQLTKETIVKSQPSLLINLDKEIAQTINNYKLSTPVFNALLTVADINKVATCLPSCAKGNSYYFVLDQPAKRQIELIKLIKPHVKTIGVLYTPNTSLLLTKLQAIAPQHQVKISGHLTEKGALGFTLNDIAKSSDIILALADTTIYNAASLPQILLTSYRHETPVIGFSKGFVKAGAISGVTSSLKQLAKQMAEVIKAHKKDGRVTSETITFPKYFDVVSNRNVAKSLLLHFPDDHVLAAKLKANEIP